MTTTPTPQPGQLWRPTRLGSRAREQKVVVTGPRWLRTQDDRNHPRAWVDSEFRAWVRRHEAVVVEPGA